METVASAARRTNILMAERVDCGIAVQSVAGTDKAKQYMHMCGIPDGVIERVLGRMPIRRQHASASSCDRRRS